GPSWGSAYTVPARPPAALLAALMAFSQPHLILAATWATPDALLCLFLLLSAWGFLLLLADERPPRWAPWAAYGGAGLAIATKGLLSLLFVAFVWAFAWREDLRGAPVPRRRALVHLPAIAVGLGTAAWWYVALAREHGIGALEAFSRYQVIADTTLVWWAPSYHLVLYAIVLAASLLPWSGALTIAGLSRPGTATEWSRGRRFERFALVWSALVVLVFSFSVWVDGRFLLPAGPLLAVALAAALDRTHRAIRTRALTAILRVCLVGFSALVVLIGLLLLALHERRSAAALLIGAGALVAALALAAKRGLLAPAIAITAFAAFPLGALGL